MPAQGPAPEHVARGRSSPLSPGSARPDAALKRLDSFVGNWTMEGNLVGSTVFSGFSPTPLPYRWDVRDDSVTIEVSYGPLDATKYFHAP